MSSLTLRNKTVGRVLTESAKQISKALSNDGPRSLSSVPKWDTQDLIGKLNALPEPRDPRKGDNAPAIHLYAKDLKKAANFHHQVACQIVVPYMNSAGTMQRAAGAKAPENVVLVGATGGMGKDLARHVAATGAFLNLVDVPAVEGGISAGLKNLAEECEAIAGPGRVQAIPAHATSDEAMLRAMQQAADFGGGTIDLLSHTAGIFGDKRAFEVTPDHLNLRLDVNARSTVVAANAAIPHMMKSQNPSFVFVSSLAARELIKNQAEYCYTKHHQHLSMKTLGDLMSNHLRIRTTELLLGHVFTPMALGRGLDVNKMLKTNDVAELVMYVAKAPPEARFAALDVVPTQRLEGKVIWPQTELERHAKN